MKNQSRTHRKAITLYLAKPLLPNLESVTVLQRSNFKCDANNDEQKVSRPYNLDDYDLS